MRVIVCLDDDLGMLFGRKRQSRDSAVLEDIKAEFGEIVILPFSQRLIEPSGIKYTLKETENDFKRGETIFLESIDPARLGDKIDELVIYRWNRRYLADMKFTLSLADFKRVGVKEFAGSSHDKITKEIFKR